jgi:hypothetical protein
VLIENNAFATARADVGAGAVMTEIADARDDRMPLSRPGPSANILERIEHPAMFLSGCGITTSMLGNPDTGSTSLSDTAQIAKNIASLLNVAQTAAAGRK